MSRNGVDEEAGFSSVKIENPFVKHIEAETNGGHFPDDIFKCIFVNENIWISITISLKFAPRGPINNIPALVEIMAWCRPGDKPLSEPVTAQFTDAYMRHPASMSWQSDDHKLFCVL